MDATEEWVGEVVVVRLQGRLDSSTAQSARECLGRLVIAAHSRIAIDLSKVPYIASAGLQVLLGLARSIQRSGGKLALFGVVPDVGEVFSISGFDKIFTIRPDDAAAIAVLGGR